MPLLWVIGHPVAGIDIAYLFTKLTTLFSAVLVYPSDMIGAPKIF